VRFMYSATPEKTGEVAIHVGLRRATLDNQLARQTKGRHAVDQAEIDHFGVAPLLAVHFLRRDAEDFGGGGSVDILAGGEGF